MRLRDKSLTTGQYLRQKSRLTFKNKQCLRCDQQSLKARVLDLSNLHVQKITCGGAHERLRDYFTRALLKSDKHFHGCELCRAFCLDVGFNHLTIFRS